MEINDDAFISGLAKVIENLFALGDKDIAGVLSESVDVEDMTGEPALVLPRMTVAGKDTYPMQQRYQFGLKAHARKRWR
jgi:hypothetical protein